MAAQSTRLLLRLGPSPCLDPRRNAQSGSFSRCHLQLPLFPKSGRGPRHLSSRFCSRVTYIYGVSEIPHSPATSRFPGGSTKSKKRCNRRKKRTNPAAVLNTRSLHLAILVTRRWMPRSTNLRPTYRELDREAGFQATASDSKVQIWISGSQIPVPEIKTGSQAPDCQTEADSLAPDPTANSSLPGLAP